MADGGHKRVEEALEDWRDAERALDAAVSEREKAEEDARSIERVEAKVAQTAVDTEATVVAAQQALHSATEAVAAVAEVSEATKDELAAAKDAERSALESQATARAEHREAQDAALERYRRSQGPVTDAPPDAASRARADEVPQPDRAG